MKHRGELDAELAGRVNGNAELKRLADAGGLDTRANAAPEGGVEENHVDGRLQHVGGKLFEVDDDGVGCQRQAKPFASAPHAVETEHRVFQIVVVEIFDRASEPNRLLGRPHRVRIETKAVSRKRSGKGAVALEIVLEREHAAFHLVRAKSILLLQCACTRNDLLGGAHGAMTMGVRVEIEDVGRKRHAIANSTAEDVAYGHAPGLPEQIETRE